VNSKPILSMRLTKVCGLKGKQVMIGIYVYIESHFLSFIVGDDYL
jgi:hypothetical protein